MGGVRKPWLAVAAYAAGALLVLQLLSASGLLDSDFIGAWSYNLLMAGAAGMVLLRLVVVPDNRVGWGLVAVGLVAWNLGDIYYELALAGDRPIPYPSLSDAFYVVLYISFIAGLRAMGGKVRSSGPVSLGLLVALLGLASIWSWLVFGDVLGAVEGTQAAIATTAVFPMLDFILLASALIAVAARGWHFDRAFTALIAGFTLLAIGDLVYAAQVANGSYVDGSMVAALWSAGAVAVAFAAWQPAGAPQEGISGARLVPALIASAAGVAIFILVLDHFQRVDALTIMLAGATLVAAVGQLSFLHRDNRDSRSAAQASEALRSASTEAALDCIVTVDENGTVCEWNDAARHTFGISRADAIGRDVAELIPPESRERYRTGLEQMRSGRRAMILNQRLEVMAMHARGGRFPVELALTQVQEQPPMFTAFLRDISERRRREEENERLAAIVRSSEDAILSRDMDGVVTAWNGGAEELYGYSAEEALGKQVLELIVPPALEEEYAQTTRDVQEVGAVAFVTQRLTKLGETIDVSLRAFPIHNLAGQMVGISTSAHDIAERRRREEEVLRDADNLLWRGRIEDALANERLLFWGQPVVDPRTGGIHHYELLLRMELDGRTIGPGEFLPYAETCELISEIDHWAVRQGVQFARDVPVAINLSAKSLSNPCLVALIRAAVDEEGAPPANLIFEITETAAAENLEAANKLVEELAAMGCHVALDDFGTGYGSFTYLKHLPVTELKIDISFIRNLVTDETDRRVVNSMVSVAANFEMITVAEGVEDRETMEMLRDMGVDLVQGYYVGYPRRMNVHGSAATTALPGGAPSMSLITKAD